MVEPDVASSTSATSSKYDFILNWITSEPDETGPLWIERDAEYNDGYSPSNSDTLEQSDSGIDINPHQQLSRWCMFRMWVYESIITVFKPRLNWASALTLLMAHIDLDLYNANQVPASYPFSGIDARVNADAESDADAVYGQGFTHCY